MLVSSPRRVCQGEGTKRIFFFIPPPSKRGTEGVFILLFNFQTNSLSFFKFKILTRNSQRFDLCAYSGRTARISTLHFIIPFSFSEFPSSQQQQQRFYQISNIIILPRFNLVKKPYFLFFKLTAKFYLIFHNLTISPWVQPKELPGFNPRGNLFQQKLRKIPSFFYIITSFFTKNFIIFFISRKLLQNIRLETQVSFPISNIIQQT